MDPKMGMVLSSTGLYARPIVGRGVEA